MMINFPYRSNSKIYEKEAQHNNTLFLPVAWTYIKVLLLRFYFECICINNEWTLCSYLIKLTVAFKHYNDQSLMLGELNFLSFFFNCFFS